jgi:D5 N terminal like
MTYTAEVQKLDSLFFPSEVRLHVNKKIVGKPELIKDDHGKVIEFGHVIVNGQKMKMPNSKYYDRHWTQTKTTSLSQLRDIILDGKTVRSQLTKIDRSIDKANESWNLDQHDWCYLDGDHLDNDSLQTFLSNSVTEQSFLVVHSWNSLRGNPESSVHILFAFDRSVTGEEFEKIVSALYHYYESSLPVFPVKKGDAGKLDTGLRDRARIMYGSKPDSEIKFDESARLIVQPWLDYFGLYKELLQSKSSETKERSAKNKKDAIDLSQNTLALNAIKLICSDLDWNDPNSFSPWEGQDFYLRQDQTKNGAQWDGHDFKYFEDAAGSSRSAVITITDEGDILYSARSDYSKSASGNFFDFLEDYFVRCCNWVLSDHSKGFDKETRSAIISAYLELKGKDYELFIELFSSTLKKEKKIQAAKLEQKMLEAERFTDKKSKVAAYEENPETFYIDGDRLVNPQAVLDVCPFFKHVASQSSFPVLAVDTGMLQNSFLDYYQDRVFYFKGKGGKHSIYWYNRVDINGKLAYKWELLSSDELQSRFHIFCDHFHKPSEKNKTSYTLEQYLYWDSKEGKRSVFNRFAVTSCIGDKDDSIIERSREYVGFTNGLLNIKTKQLEPYDPKHFTTFVFPFDWDASKADDKKVRAVFSQFFKKTTSDADHEDKIETYFNLLACGLTSNADRAKAIVSFTGSSGAGKSSMFEFVTQLLTFKQVKRTKQLNNVNLFCEENANKILSLSENKFLGVKLADANFIKMDEANAFYNANETSQIKDYASPTGKLAVEIKNGGFFTVKFQALITMLSESELRFHIGANETDGIFNRLCVFDCISVPKDQYAVVDALSKDFETKVGFVTALLMRDVEEFIFDRQQTKKEWQQERQKQVELENDFTMQFIADCLEVTNNSEDFESASILGYFQFNHVSCNMSKPNNILLSKILVQKLKKFGYTLEYKVVKVDKSSVRGYPGLRFKLSFEELAEHLKIRNETERSEFSQKFHTRFKKSSVKEDIIDFVTD